MDIIKKLIRLIDFRPIKKVQVNLVGKNNLLTGRCALITGGTGGIGFSIAKAFIDAGAVVVITGRKTERIKNALMKLPPNSALGFELDNSNIGAFEDIISNIHEECKKNGFPRIDILVNNAGINSFTMPNALEEDYDNVLSTNLKGPFFLSQFLGKYFISNNIRGNILNIASASSLRPANSAYIVSKWGIRGLTLGLAKSLGPYGITVNGIAPGPTATPMMMKGNKINYNLDRIPLGRYITPEEIANMAVVYVSDMGKSIMGDIAYMTGGAAILTYDDVPYIF